jgi:hypothetical protein
VKYVRAMERYDYMWVEWSRMADSLSGDTHHNGKVNAMQCFHTKDKHLESLLGSMTNKI